MEQIPKKPKKSITKYLVAIIIVLMLSLLLTSNIISIVKKEGIICIVYDNTLTESLDNE